MTRTPAGSVDRCLNCVAQCWSSKEPTYDEDEKEDARAAYEHAREVYLQQPTERVVE